MALTTVGHNNVLCVTLVWLHLPGGAQQQARAEMDLDSFLHWFEEWVHRTLAQGGAPRV